MDLHFTMYGRDIKFSMNYDETFIADRNMLYCLQRQNACEPEVMHLMARVLRPGDFAVDVGANIGFFTLFMAHLVGPTGRVLACEPGPNNQYKLKQNIELNGLENVDIVTSPLWNENDADVTLYLAEDSGNNSLRANPVTTGRVKLKSITLDTLIQVKRWRLIKLDVEGAEQAVLDGAGSFACHAPYIVCEMNVPALNRFGATRESLRGRMQARGYETFLLPQDGILPVLVPPATKLTSEKNNLNVLFSTIKAVGEAYPEASYG